MLKTGDLIRNRHYKNNTTKCRSRLQNVTTQPHRESASNKQIKIFFFFCFTGGWQASRCMPPPTELEQYRTVILPNVAPPTHFVNIFLLVFLLLFVVHLWVALVTCCPNVTALSCHSTAPACLFI